MRGNLLVTTLSALRALVVKKLSALRALRGEPLGIKKALPIGKASWAQKDSNLRLPACKAGTLNQLSYAPGNVELLLFAFELNLSFCPVAFSGCKCKRCFFYSPNIFSEKK